MAESINLKKRLIGKEDINFDIAGTGESENFFTPDGGEKTLTKINASHFPLTKNARKTLNAVNVDDALIQLSNKVDDFEAGDVLSEDTTIYFLPEDDVETIQHKINEQKKNLNGHTLTFLFPGSLPQKLYAPIEWQGFYNGTVLISGGSETNKVAIYDQLYITSLFRIYRCQCEVIIRYFHFVHQYSACAISAESSAAVVVDKCNFSGIENADSYAVSKSAANAILLNCQLGNDNDFYPDSFLFASKMQNYLPLKGGDISGSLSVSGSLFVSNNLSVSNGLFVSNDLFVNGLRAEAVASAGSNYIRFASGLQICWGAVEVSNHGDTYVNFQQAFSHSVSAVISPIGSGPDAPGCYASTTTLNINCGSIVSPVYWIAIGYWK